MEENKESMEQTAPEENTEQISIAESEKLTVEPNNMPEKLKKEKIASWGEKSVTRKFMVIALAAAVLLNAAVT